MSSNDLNNVLISRDKSQKSTIARPNLAIKHTHPYNLYLVFRNLTKFIYLRKEPNHNPETMKIFNFDFISTLKKELACQKETKYAFWNKYVLTYFEYVSKLETKLNLQDSSHFKSHIDIHKWLICKWLKQITIRSQLLSLVIKNSLAVYI